MKYDGSQAIKNMDDVLLYGRTLEELKTKLETFWGFCKEKNLKLKPSKMNIGEEVEFAGTAIRADTVENEEVVSILPKDKRIKAIFDLQKARNKEGNTGPVWVVEFSTDMESKSTTKFVNAKKSNRSKRERDLER